MICLNWLLMQHSNISEIYNSLSVAVHVTISSIVLLEVFWALHYKSSFSLLGETSARQSLHSSTLTYQRASSIRWERKHMLAVLPSVKSRCEGLQQRKLVKIAEDRNMTVAGQMLELLLVTDWERKIDRHCSCWARTDKNKRKQNRDT